MTDAVGPSRLVDPPVAEGSLAPDLVVDGDGVLMTWLEPDGEDGRFAVRFSRLAGPRGLQRWSEPRTVAAGDDLFVNWADFPSVVRGGDGALVAHWLRKSGPETYSYDVMLARSVDDGRTWQPLGPAHDDGTLTEHGFVSMLPDESGVRLFWLDGRDTDPDGAHAGGAMTLRTARLQETVRDSRRLDDRVCDCCQTSAVDTGDGLLVVYRDRDPDEVRDISWVRSTASGWSEPRSVARDGWEINGCPVNGPALATAPDGPTVAAWFTAADQEPRVLVAFWDDRTQRFGEPVRVDAGLAVGRVDVVIAPSGEAVVSWLERAERDEKPGHLLIRRVLPDGTRGPALPFSQVSTERAGGFPRLARLDDALVVAWTEADETTRVRVGALPLAAVPSVTTPGS